jgi:hypothetical protein
MSAWGEWRGRLKTHLLVRMEAYGWETGHVPWFLKVVWYVCRLGGA